MTPTELNFTPAAFCFRQLMHPVAWLFSICRSQCSLDTCVEYFQQRKINKMLCLVKEVIFQIQWSMLEMQSYQNNYATRFILQLLFQGEQDFVRGYQMCCPWMALMEIWFMKWFNYSNVFVLLTFPFVLGKTTKSLHWMDVFSLCPWDNKLNKVFMTKIWLPTHVAEYSRKPARQILTLYNHLGGLYYFLTKASHSESYPHSACKASSRIW